jgi:hypothetical protein
MKDMKCTDRGTLYVNQGSKHKENLNTTEWNYTPSKTKWGSLGLSHLELLSLHNCVSQFTLLILSRIAISAQPSLSVGSLSMIHPTLDGNLHVYWIWTDFFLVIITYII